MTPPIELLGALVALAPAGRGTGQAAGSTPGATLTVGPLVIGILAGIALMLVALSVWRLMLRFKRRSRTDQMVRRLLQDADAARKDPILVHQARRRIHSSRSDGY